MANKNNRLSEKEEFHQNESKWKIVRGQRVMVGGEAGTVNIIYSSEKWLFAKGKEVIEHYLEVTGTVKIFFS